MIQKRPPKRMLLIAVALVSLFAAATALADTDSTGAPRKNSLKDGAWALQFQVHIDGDFDIGGLDGGSLSMKKHTRDDAAWRFGARFSGDWTDGERRVGESGWVTSDADNSRRALTLSVHRVFYPRPTTDFNLYFGFGPELSYSRVFGESRYLDSTGLARRISSTTTRHWGIGMGAALGVEWFMNRNASLTIEYGSALEYYADKRAYESSSYEADGSRRRRNYEETLNDGIQFEWRDVRMGLSLYF